jgi:hypothetical protein
MPSKRIRPKSRDEGYQKLRTLKCFREVHERILAGWEPAAIARFVQNDRNEYTHATQVSLAQVIQRYRDTIPPAELLKTRMPKAFEEAKAEVDEGLDELKEMEKLYKLQMKRIGIALTVEEESKRLMPNVTQDVRTAREILAGYADLKMDLGLSARAGEKVDVNVNVTTDASRYGKKSVERVMNNPELRRKVLGVAERVFALQGRLEVIDAESSEVVPSTAAAVVPQEPTPDKDLEEATMAEAEDQLEIDEVAEMEALAMLAPEEQELLRAGREDRSRFQDSDPEGYPL